MSGNLIKRESLYGDTAGHYEYFNNGSLTRLEVSCYIIHQKMVYKQLKVPASGTKLSQDLIYNHLRQFFFALVGPACDMGSHNNSIGLKKVF